MMTIKSGVPGSGKTQSMVADLMDMVAAMKKTGNFRPIYTNITGLDPAVIPHFKLADMPAKDVPFVRDPNVLYTIDWMGCPPESIVVIDEAQDNGYENLSTQKAVPLHVSNFAVHRKNYALDIWLITQHPKLIHVSARRQCGKHQHYERKFGFNSAFCTEWHSCEDTLSNRKTATLSRFAFSKKYYAAYTSAAAHTKQKFKFPLWMWLPIMIVPLGVYAAPSAYNALSGAMTGKGVSPATAIGPQSKASEPVTKTVVKDGMLVTTEVTTSTAPPALPSQETQPVPLAIAGCVATAKKCACMDEKGQKVETEPGYCEAQIIGNSQPGQKDVTALIPDSVDLVQSFQQAQQDKNVLAFMEKNRQTQSLPNN